MGYDVSVSLDIYAILGIFQFRVKIYLSLVCIRKIDGPEYFAFPIKGCKFIIFGTVSYIQISFKNTFGCKVYPK